MKKTLFAILFFTFFGVFACNSDSDLTPAGGTGNPAAGSNLYPSYNTNPIAADATGMSSSAVQLAAKIKLGWNMGNSLEAIGGETAWGNPKATKALIDLVKAPNLPDKLLLDPRHPACFTEPSGFKSKSIFYAAFKEGNRMKPMEWMKKNL